MLQYGLFSHQHFEYRVPLSVFPVFSLLWFACLFVFQRERERGVELNEWGGEEDLEGVGGRERGVVGREIIIKIHCMKK